MGGSSPPAVQNPGITANLQQGYNTQAAQESQRGSMVNQSNPYGSLNYTQTGTDAYGNPTYSSSLSLSPQQQQLLNTLTGTQMGAGQEGQNLLAGAGYGNQSPTQAIGNESSGIQGQLMGQWLSAQEPWMNLQTNQLDTKLRNQGIFPSPTAKSNDPSTWGAYENQMNELTQSQQAGVAQAASQFQPTAFQEASSLYTLPATLGLQLAGFGQPTSPGGSLVQTPGANYQAPDYTGAVNSAQQLQAQEWAAQQQMMGSLFSGLLGAGGNIGASMLRGPSTVINV